MNVLNLADIDAAGNPSERAASSPGGARAAAVTSTDTPQQRSRHRPNQLCNGLSKMRRYRNPPLPISIQPSDRGRNPRSVAAMMSSDHAAATRPCDDTRNPATAEFTYAASPSAEILVVTSPAA